MNKIILNSVNIDKQELLKWTNDILVFHLNHIVKEYDIEQIFGSILKLSDNFHGIALIGLYNKQDFQIINIEEINYEIDRFCQQNNFIFLGYDSKDLSLNKLSLEKYVQKHLIIDSNYGFFANIYDENQIDIDYAKWFDIIENHCSSYDSILDVSAGSAPYVKFFNKDKYLGIDLSDEMLKIAREKNSGYVFKQGNMTTFEHRADLTISFLDGVNYLQGDEELNKFMRTLSKNLKKVAVIDIHDVDKVSKFDEYYYYQEDERGVFKWESKIISDKLIHLFTYEIDDIVKVEKHVQRLYKVEDLEKVANEYQLKCDKCYNIYDHNVLVLTRT